MVSEDGQKNLENIQKTMEEDKGRQTTAVREGGEEGKKKGLEGRKGEKRKKISN